MIVTSLPASRRRMAAVWRSVCMVTRLALMEGQPRAARVTWWARRRSIASRLRRLPVVGGNSGSAGGGGGGVGGGVLGARLGVGGGRRRVLSRFLSREGGCGPARGVGLPGGPPRDAGAQA